LGGAISVALESFVALYSCHFIKNVAYNGIGNDFTVLPIVGSAVGSNITIDSVIFDLANSTYVESLDVDVLSIDSEVCAIVTRFDKLNPSGITRSRKLLDNTRQFVTDVDIREQQIKDELMRFDDKTLTQVVWSKYKQELIAELEHISMLKYDDNIRDKSTSWSKRRKLGLLSKLNFLLQPSIVIGAGVAKFVSPIFNENYNIFIGNFLELLSIQSFYGYVTPSCSVSIGGNIEQEGLTLVSYKADVYLKRFGLASLNIEALHLINSTLYASNNITISGNSTISSSAIKSITTDLSLADYVNISNPEVNFLGNVYTGLGFQDSIGIFGFGDDDSIDSTWFPPNILFDACTVTIYKKLQITSPSFEKKSFDIKSTITLKNNALLNISSTGELGITVGTKIQADRSDLIALSNYGTVKLLGYAVSTSPFISDGSKSIVSLTDLESVYSPLTVDGIFTQSSHGKLIITIGNISSNHPSLNLYSNESLLGTIYVNINSNSDVKLYGTATPTEWQFAKYEVTKVNPIGSANIVGTNGLGYKIGYEYNATNSYKLTENLIIESISCDQLQYYYNSQSLCGYCSLNSSCSYCNNDKCVDNGQCSTVGSTSKSSCCGDSCTDEHGTCHMSSSFDYSCECTFFYSGNTCNNLSVGALGIIIASVFIFTFTVITFYYKMYYKGQKTLVLEELRQGLLQSEDGMYSSQDNTYIQSLQQELILKDVFVNYKEIKLEYKIGEGSFGVVYKAVFRGAQVAVKKMRSPLFMELTQNDIEEFRKEAYMMSRLRHPNIVLVMGISLVDQDPVKLPTTSVDGLASPMNKNNKDVKMKKIVCIITEYLEKGSLADILYGPSRLPPDVLTYERILTCAHQAARGMLYLHSLSPPIMHRDLKSSNLVVDDHWVVKVTDFGMSRIVPEKLQDLDKGLAPSEHGDDDLSKVEELSDYYFERDSLAKPPSETSFHNLENSTFNLEMTSNLGTTAWCAPELLTVSNTTKYSLKVDVYSFGMVLWELWEKKRPFDDLHSRFDIMDAIRSGKRPPISSTCPPAYRSLMERCWDPQPAKRPIFKYIEKYLKDELARVKRTNASVAIPGNFISSSLTEWNLSMSSPSAAGSATGGNVITNFLQSWGTRSRSNTMQSEQGPETQNPITSSGDKSPLRQNIMSESYTSDQAPSPKMQSGGQPNIKPNKWRDQYVMKFSGWNASQPDVGLPPTLASTSGNGFGSTVVSIPPRTTSIGSSVTNTGNDNVQNQVRRSVRERDGNSNNIIIEDNGIFSLDSDEGDSSPLENQRDFMMHNAVSVNNNNDNNNIGSNRSSKSTTIGKTE
jgi:serine/threonine protein kinase